MLNILVLLYKKRENHDRFYSLYIKSNTNYSFRRNEAKKQSPAPTAAASLTSRRSELTHGEPSALAFRPALLSN